VQLFIPLVRCFLFLAHLYELVKSFSNNNENELEWNMKRIERDGIGKPFWP
jgi:hypothetical protein